MKNFLVVARYNTTTNEDYINKVKDYIIKNGGNCFLDVQDEFDQSSQIEVSDDIQCVITVGGDGTVVRVAHALSRSDVPIVGLNCGHLGYLCDMTKDNIEHCLDQLLSDSFKVDERMMLEGCLDGENRGRKALNDIVVSARDSGMSVLYLKVSVNGIPLYSHNCDGLIVATPTGSTAYNLSANGPIVSPHSDCIILTPINPHTLNSRSIILASSDEIEIEMGIRHENDGAAASIIYDGDKCQCLTSDSKLRIYKAADTTKMVILENVSFIERLRARMQEI